KLSYPGPGITPLSAPPTGGHRCACPICRWLPDSDPRWGPRPPGGHAMLNSLRSWLRDTTHPRRTPRLTLRPQPPGLHLEHFEDRITPTAGALDTNFGFGGKVTTNFVGQLGDFTFQGTDHAAAVAVQADGKIVVVGDTDAGIFSQDFALARYNMDGSLDTTFG